MRSYLALDGANGFKFRWRGSYLNYVWFDVIEPNGARCELEFRTRLSDYEAGIYNGGPDRYRRDCGPLVNVLRKSSGLSGDPVSPELVAAFNAWQAADRAVTVHLFWNPEDAHAYIERNRERLDLLTSTDDL